MTTERASSHYYFGARVERSVEVIDAPTLEQFEQFRRAKHARPVVLRNAFANEELIEQWTPDYLKQRLGDKRVHVYVSADGRFPGGRGPYDDRKHRAVEMSLGECVDRIVGKTLPPILTEGERCYLYQAPETAVGDLLDEVRDPPYVPARWLSERRVLRNLWFSGEGNITPPHHDYVENLLVQVNGVKRVLLWSPEQYEQLYVIPWGHVHDRQSPVDVKAPDLAKYPRFAEARALTAILNPGDMIYMPFGWLHYVETEKTSVSINYWWPLPLKEGGLDAAELWKTVLFQLLIPWYELRPELRELTRALLRQRVQLQRQVLERLVTT